MRWTRLWYVAVLAAAAGVTAPGARCQEASDSLLTHARLLLDSGLVHDAVDASLSYISRHRDDARGFMVLGEAYERVPHARLRALEAYYRAQALTPDAAAASAAD